jgi:3-oxoacyl-[acyl-carrier-protein] synthase-3
MFAARIIGTGSYAPEKVVTNDDLAKVLATSDEWITTRTGIKQRHIARDDEQTSDMALAAARRALEMAGKKPTDLDLIIVGTISGDMPMPSCAAFLQHKLGARCAAFDVSAACAGSIYGLSIAEKFVKLGSAKNVLVVGVELLSRLLDWEDRSTAVLFGDAAGAMLLSGDSDKRRGLLHTRIHADGAQTGILNIPGGGSIHPASHAMIDQKLHLVKMAGREVYKTAVRVLVEVVEELLALEHLAVGDVHHFVPHQANLRIVEAVLDRLGVPLTRAILNIDRYGNTSSASVPVTLDEGLRSGRIREGELAAMMAVGGGMAWGGALVRF